jgi:hypothetical protein
LKDVLRTSLERADVLKKFLSSVNYALVGENLGIRDDLKILHWGDQVFFDAAAAGRILTTSSGLTCEKIVLTQAEASKAPQIELSWPAEKLNLILESPFQKLPLNIWAQVKNISLPQGLKSLTIDKGFLVKDDALNETVHLGTGEQQGLQHLKILYSDSLQGLDLTLHLPPFFPQDGLHISENLKPYIKVMQAPAPFSS